MLKLPLWTALVILAAMLACGEQTSTPGRGRRDGASLHGSRNICAQSGDIHT